MEEEMVTITKKEYEQLLEADAHLNILFRRGVDNWEWYCGMPSRADYETDEEWNAAVEHAISY